MPPLGPWAPFAPSDQTPLDAPAVVAGAEALRTRLEGLRATIEKVRRAGAPGPSGDRDHPHPGTPPSRAEEMMPFLLIRTYPGDIGARPIVGVPLSQKYPNPDILLALPPPAGSPPEPTVRDRAQFLDPAFQARLQARPLQQATTTYDVWVHVWNLGRAPAFGVRVRAWIQRGMDPPPGEFIGGRRIDLGDRTQPTAHRVVRVGQVSFAWEDANIWANAESITDVSLGTTADALRSPAPWGVKDDPYKDRHTSFRNVLAAGASPWPLPHP